jgi:Uma2 family endonuclease
MARGMVPALWKNDSRPPRSSSGRAAAVVINYSISEVAADEPCLFESADMNVPFASRVTSAAEGLPRRRFTVAEVEAMVAAGVMEEDERVELIGGELVPMSPKGLRHEVVKTALADRWYRLPHDDCGLAVATTFRLSEDTYLESDAVIYPRATGLKELTGANALLVVEIADSSLRYDMGRKAALYASFGVRELWVIDAVKLAARAFRAPSPSGYGETRDFGAADRLVPLFAPDAFALRLDELDLS